MLEKQLVLWNEGAVLTFHQCLQLLGQKAFFICEDGGAFPNVLSPNFFVHRISLRFGLNLNLSFPRESNMPHDA